MFIGYHFSHEQHKPSELLQFAILAEQAGFSAGLSSDHFHPWNEAQGQSGFAWSWLGAALQATALNFGIVNAPGQRYHPAIIAQAAATLAPLSAEDRHCLAGILSDKPYDKPNGRFDLGPFGYRWLYKWPLV